jgi:PmbA protein
MLDLKYARRANMAPTPLPLTGSALEVQTDDLAIWDEVVASLDRGLIVYEILGMHTQDSVSGHFSVVASQALVVRDGVPVGRAKAALTGNFFETLHDPNTRFVRWSVERNPGMLLPCRVAAS